MSGFELRRTSFQRHTYGTPTAFQRHFNGIPTTFLRHSDDILTAFWRRSDDILMAFWWHSDGILKKLVDWQLIVVLFSCLYWVCSFLSRLFSAFSFFLCFICFLHTPGWVVHWKSTVRICSMDDRWQSVKVQKTVHCVEFSKSVDDVRWTVKSALLSNFMYKRRYFFEFLVHKFLKKIIFQKFLIWNQNGQISKTIYESSEHKLFVLIRSCELDRWYSFDLKSWI